MAANFNSGRPPFGKAKPGASSPGRNGSAAAQSGHSAAPKPGAGEFQDPKPEKQLAIPEAAAADSGSFELLRVWVAEQAQQITLRPGIWQEPSAWGVMLADLARSIVQVHADHDEDLDTEAFLAAVLEGFDTEIESVLEEFGEGDAG